MANIQFDFMFGKASLRKIFSTFFLRFIIILKNLKLYCCQVSENLLMQLVRASSSHNQCWNAGGRFFCWWLDVVALICENFLCNHRSLIGSRFEWLLCNLFLNNCCIKFDFRIIYLWFHVKLHHNLLPWQYLDVHPTESLQVQISLIRFENSLSKVYLSLTNYQAEATIFSQKFLKFHQNSVCMKTYNLCLFVVVHVETFSKHKTI